MLSKVRQLRGEERGNALVEFAIVLAVLLSLLFGIIDVGRALYAYDWLYNAARQTTRWAMVRGTFCSDPLHPLPGCPATPDGITDYVKNTNGNGLDTSGIDTTQLTVTPKCRVTGGATWSVPPCAELGFVQVQLTYNFYPISPWFRAAVHSLHGNYYWSMSSSSQRIVQN